MKYANQINLTLAAAGVMVVLYALSMTFLSSSPSATLNVQQLVREGSTRVVARPPSTDVTPMMRNSTTSARGSLVSGLGGQGTQSSGVVGMPGPGDSGSPPTRRTPAGGTRTLPSTRSVRVGNAADTSPGSRSPEAAPDSVNQDEDSPTYDTGRPVVIRQRPPAGAESAKRGTSPSDTPAPPTRASMPVQQRRP